MFSDQEIAELRGDKPSMKLPVLFLDGVENTALSPYLKSARNILGNEKLSCFSMTIIF